MSKVSITALAVTLALTMLLARALPASPQSRSVAVQGKLYGPGLSPPMQVHGTFTFNPSLTGPLTLPPTAPAVVVGAPPPTIEATPDITHPPHNDDDHIDDERAND